jgi:hypothetical protein
MTTLELDEYSGAVLQSFGAVSAPGKITVSPVVPASVSMKKPFLLTEANGMPWF